MDTVLQIRVFRMAGDFLSERSNDHHEQGVKPQWEPTDRIQDNFLILKISKLDIGLINILFCCFKKGTFGSKNENLITLYWLSYAITMWVPITAYKLAKYLFNIHLMLFKKFMF